MTKPVPHKGFRFSFGTHNLHDEAGVPTAFADAIMFTEAIPHTIEDDIGRPTVKQRARAAAARAQLRLRGRTVRVCTEQPDLVFVARRRLFKVHGHTYTRFVDGVPHVTPNRGTFVVFATHRRTGTKIAFIGEHRINAAFPPYIRGEALFRRQAWKGHTAGTERILERLRGSWVLIASGDLNTPRTASGYPSWIDEVGTSLDRIGAASPRGPRAIELDGPEYLSRSGSDHPRLRAIVTVRTR